MCSLVKRACLSMIMSLSCPNRYIFAPLPTPMLVVYLLLVSVTFSSPLFMYGAPRAAGPPDWGVFSQSGVSGVRRMVSSGRPQPDMAVAFPVGGHAAFGPRHWDLAARAQEPALRQPAMTGLCWACFAWRCGVEFTSPSWLPSG